jgi:hypothetical protein
MPLQARGRRLHVLECHRERHRSISWVRNAVVVPGRSAAGSGILTRPVRDRPGGGARGRTAGAGVNWGER